jgi:hypothetical protein
MEFPMLKLGKLCSFLAISLLAVYSPIKGFAQTPTPTAPCVLGYTVGFFNGVWNTELDAMDGLNGVQDAVRETTGNPNDTYNHEDVTYQLLYNHTGSTVGDGKWQDVAEVFIQRADAADSTGQLANDGFYMVWEFLNRGAGIVPLVSGQSPAFSAAVNQFVGDFTSAAASAVGYYTANPPTSQDYAAQQTELSTQASAGRRLVLVAHSQGNIFMDVGYDFIQPVVGSTRVKAVHVAPASATVRGQYILSDNDLVINALRLVGGSSSIQSNNIDIPFSSYDYSGHTLVATYLDVTRPGRAQTELLLNNAFVALTSPSTCQVSVTATKSNVSAGGNTTLTAAVNPAPADPTLNVEYQWTVTGTAGGTLTGGVATLNTASATVTYQAAAAAPQASIDKISVAVLVAKTPGDYVNAETLGTGSATVSIVPSSIPVTANPSTLAPSGTSTVTANVSVFPNLTGFSYLWATPGAFGTLSSGGTTGNSMCTTSPKITYIADAQVSATSSNQDPVTVNVFSAPNCATTNAAGEGSAQISVTPSKDLDEWGGQWTCTSQLVANATPFGITIVVKPVPDDVLPYVPDRPYDLYITYNGQPDTDGAYYGFIETAGETGWDARAPTAQAAYNSEYDVYSVAGGTLTFTDIDNGLSRTCVR